jgi:hypothetical protein
MYGLRTKENDVNYADKSPRKTENSFLEIKLASKLKRI